MSEPNQPTDYDAVRSQLNADVSHGVLGGIESFYQLLNQHELSQQIAALQDALKYGNATLLLRCVRSTSCELQWVSHWLLQEMATSHPAVAREFQQACREFDLVQQWSAYARLWDSLASLPEDQIKFLSETFRAFSDRQGLVAYYRFEDEQQIGKDYSTRGQDGTVVGALSLAPGAVGHALNFSGQVGDSSYRCLLIPNTLSNPYSISLWINLKASGGHHSLLMLPGSGGWTSAYFWLFTAQDRLAVLQNEIDLRYNDAGRRPDNFHPVYLASPAWVPDIFSFVTVTYQDGTLKLYLNQDEYAVYQNVPPLPDKREQIILGWSPSGTGNYQVDGKLDELRIYDRVLAPAEIQALYALGA